MQDFLDFLPDFPEFLLVFFNVEPGYTAYRQSQKFINILVGHIAQQQRTVGGESGVNLPVFILLTAALFDFFIDAVFKEYLGEGFGVMQFILFGKINLQLLLEISDQFFHVAFQHFAHAHLNRFPVADDHDPRRDGDRTVGIHIQPLHGLFRGVSPGGGDPDMDVVGGEIIHT